MNRSQEGGTCFLKVVSRTGNFLGGKWLSADERTDSNDKTDEEKQTFHGSLGLTEKTYAPCIDEPGLNARI